MRVQADGAGIEYEVTGDGRPVILLHQGVGGAVG